MYSSRHYGWQRSGGTGGQPMARTGSAGVEQRRECNHIRNLIEALDLSIETPSGGETDWPCAEETMSMDRMEPLRISSGWSKYVRVRSTATVYTLLGIRSWISRQGRRPSDSSPTLGSAIRPERSMGASCDRSRRCDGACGRYCANRRATPERGYVSAVLDASPANAASLLAIGKVLSMRSRLAFADATIRTDSGVCLRRVQACSLSSFKQGQPPCKPFSSVSLDNSLKSE